MKKSIYALFACAILVSTTSVLSIFEYSQQEKREANNRIITLEQKKETTKKNYTESLAHNPEKKAELQQQFNKDMQSLRAQIEQQKQIIKSAEKKLIWRAVGILGGIALLGLLTYKLLVTPSTLSSSPIILENKPPVVVATPTMTTSSIMELEQPVTESLIQNQIPEVAPELPEKPLSESEKTLYTLKYKNMKNVSLWYLLSASVGWQIFGPLNPAAILSLAAAGLSAGRALYYKTKLNPEIVDFFVSPARTDLDKFGYLLPY